MLGSPVGLTRKFLFWGGVNFPEARASISEENAPGRLHGREFALAATSLWAMDLDSSPEIAVFSGVHCP
jgi:hypothetical protein